MLAIPSIALSSIVAVLGGILPSDMVEIGVHGVRTNPSPSAVCSAIVLTVTTLTRGAVSALCNAMNTIALGLMALMRFESKSSLHTQGACTLQSLKVQQLELRDKLHLCTS